MEWEGERGCPPSDPMVLLFLWRRVLPVGEDPCRGDREPGLLLEDVGRVTDSKMREWASLGVKRGARSSGLRFVYVPSKREEVCGWWWWCSGEKSRLLAPAPPLEDAVNPEGGTPLDTGPGTKPTSSAVSGGGRKLSKTGLRMRPSLAYFADEKHSGLWEGADDQRKVGSRRMERRLSWHEACMGAPVRNGGMPRGMIHEECGWWSPTPAGLVDEPDGGCCPEPSTCWGGGGDEPEGTAEEAWCAPTCEDDMRMPVAGLMMVFFLGPIRLLRPLPTNPAPLLTPCPRRPRLPRSRSLVCSCSCSDGGEEGRDGCIRGGSSRSSPWDEPGERSGSSDRACVPSEACESQEESSRLGELEREDSPDESCEECCETALEPHEAALLLKRPLLVLLLQLPATAALLRRLEGMLTLPPPLLAEMAGTTGGGGGGRLSPTEALPPGPTDVAEEGEEVATSVGEGAALG